MLGVKVFTTSPDFSVFQFKEEVLDHIVEKRENDSRLSLIKGVNIADGNLFDHFEKDLIGCSFVLNFEVQLVFPTEALRSKEGSS